MFIKKKLVPDLSAEQTFNGKVIAGIDEVGRGPLAGPLVVSAVILDYDNIPQGINDSKVLTSRQREFLFHKIIETSKYGIGIVTVDEIDKMKLTLATELAMRRALLDLDILVDIALIDGNISYKLPTRSIPIIGGDKKSLSIAAASIVAKVIRDGMMKELSKDFPGYHWEKNVGYGTKTHIKAIREIGLTIHHRKSFGPISKIINKELQLFTVKM